MFLEKQKVGSLGEDIAVKYLENKGFLVVGRNYRKKFGEIDVIANKKDILHFVEVKTLSVRGAEQVSNGEIDNGKSGTDAKFVHSAQRRDFFRPEDNVHSAKLKRLSRAIQAYLAEYSIGEDSIWQFDVVTVLLDSVAKTARVKMIEDVIL